MTPLPSCRISIFVTASSTSTSPGPAARECRRLNARGFIVSPVPRFRIDAEHGFAGEGRLIPPHKRRGPRIKWPAATIRAVFLLPGILIRPAPAAITLHYEAYTDLDPAIGPSADEVSGATERFVLWGAAAPPALIVRDLKTWCGRLTAARLWWTTHRCLFAPFGSLAK